jgi:hypothetical protein
MQAGIDAAVLIPTAGLQSGENHSNVNAKVKVKVMKT